MRGIASHAGRRPPPARKPWEAAVPVAQANRQRANGRASESLDDVPHRPQLPSYPADRLPDLYGSLSTRLGMSSRGRLGSRSVPSLARVNIRSINRRQWRSAHMCPWPMPSAVRSWDRMCGRPRFGKGCFDGDASWSGAAMCSACLRGTTTAGPNAIRGSGPSYKHELDAP